MITPIQTLASLAELDMDAIIYQVTGMVVVFVCLGFLSVLLTISGAVAQRLDAARKAKAEAARAALAAAMPPPPPASVAEPPASTAPTPEELASIAAGIYGAALDRITPEVIACIAAAVKVTVGNEAQILSINPVSTDYARGGRSHIMNSHFPVRG